MKKIRQYTLMILAAAFFLPACTDNFVEKNTDPNAITAVTPDLLLPGIIRTAVNQMVDQSWSIGNIVIQHTAKIQFVSEDRYTWGDRDGLWENMYNNLRNVQLLIEISDRNKANNYKGISLIMRAWMYSLLTDAYGDIPYSEATKGVTGILQPKYETQEAVYNGILADLKTANEILGPGEVVVGDLIYNGDVSKWKKLANSLRLRYLMRISNVKDVKADMQAIIDNPTANPVFSDANKNEDNGVLRYLTSAPNQFPLYTARQGSFDEFRLSKNLGDKLTALADPRIAIFAQPTDASVAANAPKYVGVPNGLNEVAALDYNGGPNNVSRAGSLFYKGSITERGLNVAKGYIMGYPELQFILAEAVKKGLVKSPKTAKIHYEEGVKAAFGYANVTMPANYLTTPGSAYSETDALTLIGTQKWIALFFTGLEAWFDWRRTGIPTITPGVDNVNSGKVPVRFAYPRSEQTLNPTSLAEAVSRQGADNYNTKVWWDK
ncbi:SusD/RagB family nutrient-binding outer membrane lipoprotein [Dyadobacter chenhuakuii]|uniref:SusD/RagB family nutrient-binding outer membrane lipoprotein n=1 Tax=Dyadobacter chenhuakuii TaxID=2909339 RepID=A0ABY4XPQ6_9BACT|nr:SusD/RagB family nutrient-binding outer membrane lipoprotein [Dyadobacter chenhuakuii]MCF2493282.1 SusD/RagB family nutrient-binding outer membrane lipoprotein [Dyadobacter chenhuakuii]USJ32436.1 SusD/RagB family nutrient-binding outer membrane lipoprotein [Dyadobacter chenhuakuii]